jgi:hypothetical protein
MIGLTQVEEQVRRVLGEPEMEQVPKLGSGKTDFAGAKKLMLAA